MTTEKAPVAGGAAGGRGGDGAGGSAAGGRFGMNMANLSAEDRAILRALAREDLPGAQAAAELFGLGSRRGGAAAGGGSGAAAGAAGGGAAAGAADAIGSGAAAAAGVLTAVDEDGEGAEEAPVPREFDYYTDAEEDVE